MFIYGSLNDGVTSSSCVACNGRIITNNEMEKRWSGHGLICSTIPESDLHTVKYIKHGGTVISTWGCWYTHSA